MTYQVMGIASRNKQIVITGLAMTNPIRSAKSSRASSKPLGEASGDDEIIDYPSFLRLDELENHLDRFLYGLLDKGTGVDDDDVRFLNRRRTHEAVIRQET